MRVVMSESSTHKSLASEHLSYRTVIILIYVIIAEVIRVSISILFLSI